MCEELNHSYSSLFLFIRWLWFDRNCCWFAHTTDGVAFHSHYNTIIMYYVCQDLQLNIPTVESGESGLHRSLQNGMYITENKCCLQSAWQTKEKHMQRNMIKLISCQGFVSEPVMLITQLGVFALHGFCGISSTWWLCWNPLHDFETFGRVRMAYCIQSWESNCVYG